MYVCMCVCGYADMSVCVHSCVYVFVPEWIMFSEYIIHARIVDCYLFGVHVRGHVCVSVCVWVCMYVSMYVNVCMYACM